jgi:predicted ester cyclase
MGELDPRAEGQRNLATVRRVFEEVINEKKLETIDEIYDPSIVDHDPLPGAPPGIEGVKYSIGGLIDGFPDLQVAIEDISAFGNFVAVHNTWTGTQTGRLLGLPPSGRAATFTGVVIWRLENGQIAERWALVDFVQQLGVASRKRRNRPTSLDLAGSVTPYVSLQPIPADKFEAWEEFQRQLAGPRHQEYVASRRRLGVQREVAYLVMWPREGDLRHEIVYYELEDVVRFGQGLATSDDPFDAWFRERVTHLHGFDWGAVAELGPSSHMVFEWAAD